MSSGRDQYNYNIIDSFMLYVYYIFIIIMYSYLIKHNSTINILNIMCIFYF